MQRFQIFLCTYSLLLWSQWCLARRGGGGSDDSGGGNTGGGGSYDDGDEDDDSESGGGEYVPYEPPCISCECKERDQRIKIFLLPGSYYNGSVTINHIVSTNSARDAANIPESQIGCNSDDASPKNYTYPALFTVGSNLNASDTNPIFWNLRGFNPPNEYTGGESHIFAELIHVRSSDFATNYWTTGDISSSYPRETHTYWTTNVVATGPSAWAANATYTAQPQQESSKAANFPNPHFVVRSSNYIALADVCAYDQELYFTDRKIPPISPLPLGNSDTFDSVPTIFFDLGAQASLENIGSNDLEFSMKGSVRRQAVSTGQSSYYSCPGTGSTAYYSTLQPS